MAIRYTTEEKKYVLLKRNTRRSWKRQENRDINGMEKKALQ